MAGISLKISGIEAAIKRLESKQKNIEQEIQNELNAWALETANKAKQLAPVHEGLLRQSINPLFEKNKASITVNAFYAAYIEFGTRKFAASYISSLPTEWEQFAAQYKGGGGGSFIDLVKNITEWVRLKGIDQKAAYPIALKILRDGIKPQPYLYPAVQQTTPDLIKNIKEVIK
jgi:HK97 gp10 family phage protein